MEILKFCLTVPLNYNKICNMSPFNSLVRLNYPEDVNIPPNLCLVNNIGF